MALSVAWQVQASSPSVPRPVARDRLHRVRQLVALAARTGEERVGLLVADEELLLGVPAELSSQLAGDVGDVADADRAVADLDIGDRLLAGLDAVEPVLDVVLGLPARALPDLGLLRLGRVLDQLAGSGGELV